jgi:hypothetical protein
MRLQHQNQNLPVPVPVPPKRMILMRRDLINKSEKKADGKGKIKSNDSDKDSSVSDPNY